MCNKQRALMEDSLFFVENRSASPADATMSRVDASSIWHQVWVRHLRSLTNPHCGLFLLSNQARGRKNHVAEDSEAEQQWPCMETCPGMETRIAVSKNIKKG